MDQKFWDERYRESDRMWSNNPNPVLVEHATTLTPGRALDLGSGEGADARWLAEQGWAVTAVDISQVAIDRAREFGGTDAITWQQGDPVAEPPPARSYDLVSAQYFPVPKTPDDTSARGLIESVAPGGTLLIVFHAIPKEPHENWRGGDPRDYYQPHDFAGLLDDTWTIEVDHTQERTTAPPGGSHHTHDTVLRATRKA